VKWTIQIDLVRRRWAVWDEGIDSLKVVDVDRSENLDGSATDSIPLRSRIA
jgi:hypothetical protein